METEEAEKEKETMGLQGEIASSRARDVALN